MTIAEPANLPAAREVEEPQRFVFGEVDWGFYEEVDRRLRGRRVFVTFYKGSLEVVTTSLLHEQLSNLFAVMLWVLAEELELEIVAAGRTTLRRVDLEVAVEPDASFYIGHQAKMIGRSEINLPNDPPPDLAIEVEVTHRLGARRSIYQEMGVPEIWIYSVTEGPRVLVRQPDGTYATVSRSGVLPLLSTAAMAAALKEGLTLSQTAFTKTFSQQVRQQIEARDHANP